MRAKKQKKRTVAGSPFQSYSWDEMRDIEMPRWYWWEHRNDYTREQLCLLLAHSESGRVLTFDKDRCVLKTQGIAEPF